MHLKSYEIDGLVLRTGAANFSASGLKRQDNDLIVIKDAQAAAKFKHALNRDLPAASLSFGHKSCRAPSSPAGEARQQHSHDPGNEYSVKSASAAD
jgi:phosphatidylserine/phosphatidylglycerophosphate/cardiolipin synthase-like enzyme